MSSNQCCICVCLQNAETVRVLSGMKNDKDNMQITKEQVSNELDRIRQENRAQVRKDHS